MKHRVRATETQDLFFTEPKHYEMKAGQTTARQTSDTPRPRRCPNDLSEEGWVGGVLTTGKYVSGGFLGHEVVPMLLERKVPPSQVAIVFIALTQAGLFTA